MGRLDLVDDWILAGKEAHYSSPLLARSCSVSASQLRRYFQYVYGLSPQKWLDELRIWHALELLCAGRSVKEAAGDLFFSTVSHFCHQYRSFHQCTPTESVYRYRRLLENALSQSNDDEQIVRPWKVAERRLAAKRNHSYLHIEPELVLTGT
jgi:AraC-like DNA-binding protein